MTDDCIFCSIVDGDIPSYTVYEDDDVMAFLDANPLARGHTLVIPKEHHERVNDLPANLSTATFDAVHDLTDRVEAAVDAEATTIAVNNGPAAGQEVPHVHVHIVPRGRRWPPDPRPDRGATRRRRRRTRRRGRRYPRRLRSAPFSITARPSTRHISATIFSILTEDSL